MTPKRHYYVSLVDYDEKEHGQELCIYFGTEMENDDALEYVASCGNAEAPGADKMARHICKLLNDADKPAAPRQEQP